MAAVGTEVSLDFRRLDPPAAKGAQAFSLQRLADGIGLVWLEPEAKPEEEGTWSLRFSRFDGAAWSSPSEIARGSKFFVNWADTPGLVESSESEGADPVLHAHWLEKTADGTYTYGVFIARSTNGGQSWTRVGRLHDDDTDSEHGFVSWVPESGGARAFWLDGRETVEGRPMSLRTAHVGADGIGASELIDASVCDCCSTAAAQGPTGPMVAYRDRSDEEIRDISVVFGNAGQWTAPQPAVVDGWRIHGCPVNGPALAANTESTTLAWFTAADEPRVLLARVGVGEDAFGPAIEIDRGSLVLGRVGLGLPARGGAVVSWLAGTAESAAIKIRRHFPHGVLGPILDLVPVSGVRASGVPKLVLAGPDGDTLFVAYRDPKAADGVGELQVLELDLETLDAAGSNPS